MARVTKRVHSHKEGNKLPENNNNNWLRNKEDYNFYNSRTWRKFSKDYKRLHPVCELQDCTQPSYYTDHIRPISEGGDKFDYNNLQALCKKCNASKTGGQSKKKY